MVKRELDISENAEMTSRGSVVANSHVPQLDVVVERDEDRLLGMHVPVVASEFGIREAVTALVAGMVETLAHRLPGDGPVFAGVVVADVDVVTRPVERHAVRAKAGDAAMLGAFVEGISAGVVRNHRAEVAESQVVSPGNRYIRTLDYVLAVFVVKMTVAHKLGYPLTNWRSNSTNSEAFCSESASTERRRTGSVPENLTRAQLSFSR